MLQPAQTAIGIGLVLLGIPVYWYWRRKSKEAYAS